MGNKLGLCEQNKNEKLNLKLPKQLNFHRFQNTLLFLDQGDIKEEDVDVIICQTDVILNLPNGLTYNMTLEAQKELTKELEKIKANKNYVYGDVLFSHAEELEFDYLFYCVLPEGNDLLQQIVPQKIQLTSQSQQQTIKIKVKKTDSSVQKGQNQKYQKQYIYDCVIKCIKLAEELEINSICLPILISSNLTHSQVATMMLVTIKHYVEENQAKMKFLNTIRICVYDQNHVDAFLWSFIEVCKKPINSATSDKDSEGSDIGEMEEIELENKVNKNNNNTNTNEIRRLSQYNIDSDDFGGFGVSYQDKVQGVANVSQNRKGSL